MPVCYRPIRFSGRLFREALILSFKQKLIMIELQFGSCRTLCMVYLSLYNTCSLYRIKLTICDPTREMVSMGGGLPNLCRLDALSYAENHN